MQKRTYLIIAVLVLVCAGIAAVVWKPIPAAAPASQTQPQPGSVSVTIQGLYTSKQVAITSDETVLALLQSLDSTDPSMYLTTKAYTGLGTLVTGMGTLQNGSGSNYWQYRVNGVMPQIGADQYHLKSNDAVEWFFGPSQEQ